MKLLLSFWSLERTIISDPLAKVNARSNDNQYYYEAMISYDMQVYLGLDGFSPNQTNKQRDPQTNGRSAATRKATRRKLSSRQ